MAVKVGRDILDPGAQIFFTADHIIDNGDGTISFATDPQVSYVWNEQGSYGIFKNDATQINAWERFRRNGPGIVASWSGHFYTVGEF